MLKQIKQKLKANIVKKVIKKIFNFYNKMETIYPEPLNIKKTEKILVLAPHPDDESIGCGGLLLKYASQCNVICLTDGRYGDLNIEPSKMIEIRQKEFESVMRKLAINNFALLRIEDSKLEFNYDTFKQINFNKYNYIFIPNNLDQHPDHKAVAKHIKKAYIENKIKDNVKIVMYEVWGTLPLPNRYVDLSDIINKKKEIINMYHSQVKHIDYANKITALNEYRGISVNKNSIETYFEIKMKDFYEL